MGCDIHSMVEVYRERYQGGGFAHRDEIAKGAPWDPGSSRWIKLEEEIFPNTYYDSTSTYEPFTHKMRSVPLDDRNYTLFSLLADVRNGRGFAGVPTYDRVEPLSEPRGVPDDASFAWLAEVDGWDVDMHSHSWFTLAELLEFRTQGKLAQRMRRTGVITGVQYEKLKRDGGSPDGWSGSISGQKIITVSPEEYDAGIRAEEYSEEEIETMRTAWQGGRLRERMSEEQINQRLADHIAEGRTYVQYVWEDNTSRSVKELEDAINALERYAKDLAPDDGSNHVHEGKDYSTTPGYHGHGGIPFEHIRIVFGFDN